jgi:hypothetical protein
MLRNRRARRGGVSLWTLLAIPVVVLLFILGVASCEVTLLAEQSRRTADACAHDATLALVGDDLLRARLGHRGSHGNHHGGHEGEGNGGRHGNGHNPLRQTIDAAHAEAERAACMNPIGGRHFVPDRNRDNDPCGEFVVGRVRHYGFRAPFDPCDRDYDPAPNAVRIQFDRRGPDGVRLVGGIRESIVVTATAMLDDEVCGFRPTHPECVLPVAPIALDRRVWDDEIRPTLPDIRFRLMAKPDPDPRRNERPTAVPLTIGTRNIPELCAQVVCGVRAGECERFERSMDCRFELDEEKGRLVIPGDRYTGQAHDPLWDALKDLKKSGDVRVWPTTVQFDPRNDHRVWATGFVAARVVKVKEDEITYRPIPCLPYTMRVNVLDVTVRPAMLCTPTAVTRRKAPANPYVCTVRLVTAE